jgi:death-on-curing protein
VTEPRWLSPVYILSIHADQIQSHGGSLGIRDRGLLLSALERPRNRFQYEPDVDLADLAAAYAFGLSSNHPFVDGNKRAGVLAAVVFLDVNGISIDHPSEALYALTMGVAEGRIEKAAVAVELERIAKART